MIFFIILFFFVISPLESQNYQRIIVTGEQKISLTYNGTLDTIPFQKTMNLYTINPSPSTEKSTISFWFKPSISPTNPMLRRRNLVTTTINSTSGTFMADGQNYTITYLNFTNTSLDTFDYFNTNLAGYTSSFIFNILGTSTDNNLCNMIAASYINTGTSYSFVFQTNTKSFEVPLSTFSFDSSNWVFVAVGVDYSVADALITSTFIQNDTVIQTYVNLDTPMNFLNVSMNLGAMTKYPNEFQKNTACNCGISSVIWYVDLIFSFGDTFNLRRTFMSLFIYFYYV